MLAEIETMIEEIRQRGETEAKRIIEEARRKADAMVEEAKRRVKMMVMAEARPQVLTLRRRVLGTVELEGRRKMIKVKEEVVDRVVEMAKARIEGISSGKDKRVDYREILYSLIKEAVNGVGESKVYISANERDLKYLKRNLNSISKRLSRELGFEVKLGIDEKPINCMGGVIVRNEDCTKVYYNTLDGRLNEAVKRFRSFLGKTLFKG